MSEFARQVVREEAPLALLMPRVAVQKRREKLVGAILGSQVYCHFETAGRRMRCAFSNESKALLGETVRDWLAADHGVRDFIWCEVLDDVLALVVVRDGNIIKDVADARDATREVATALSRLDDQTPVFVHPSVDHDALASHPQARICADSVRDRLARLRAQGVPVAELGPLNELRAVKRWNAWWRGVKVTTFSAAAAAVLALAYLYISRDEGAAAQDRAAARARTLTEYDGLLKEPDARVLLDAMHGAYRQFLGDPFFGPSWKIQDVMWRRSAKDELRIVAELPHSAVAGDSEGPTADDDDVQFGVPREELIFLQRSIGDYARERGWRVALDSVNKLRVTVYLPVVVLRRPQEAERNRLRRPSGERGKWHLRTLRLDLEAFGTLRQVTDETRLRTARGSAPRAQHRSYSADNFRLDLKGLEWAYPEASRWLGERLSGGPVVLDEVNLERAADSGGNILRGWRGKIVFRTIWCRDDAGFDSCEAPLPTTELSS